MLILPSMYQSTILGTSVRPRAPPNALPSHFRPVTSWKGRVEAARSKILTENADVRIRKTLILLRFSAHLWKVGLLCASTGLSQ